MGKGLIIAIFLCARQIPFAAIYGLICLTLSYLAEPSQGVALTLGDCPVAEGETFEAEISLEIPDPKINHSLSRVEIGRISTHGLTGDILGIHTSGVKLDYSARFAAEPFEENFCFWVRVVKIKIHYQVPEIFIAREYPKSSCNYRAILEHERVHAAIAEEVLKEFKPRFRAALRSLNLPKYDYPILVNSKDQARQETDRVIRKLILPVYHGFEYEHAKAQSKIDTPAQRNKVFRKCRNW